MNSDLELKLNEAKAMMQAALQIIEDLFVTLETEPLQENEERKFPWDSIVYRHTHFRPDEIFYHYEDSKVHPPYNDSCPICMVTWTDENTITTFVCRHAICHNPCTGKLIKNQLRARREESSELNCPICRCAVGSIDPIRERFM